MAEKFGPEKDPVMPVGRYAGTKVSQLPVSYCRWIIMQKFGRDITEAAKKKVDASAYSDVHLSITRHALDMFSLRFLDYWLQSEAHSQGMGLASFVAEYAERAWAQGKDVSKNRHEDDGIVKELLEMRFVFAVSQEFPEYREVITCYPRIQSHRWKLGDNIIPHNPHL